MSRERAAADGFTFIEIIVVVAVLMILAGMAVPMSGRIVSKNRYAVTETEMQRLSDALKASLSETGSWPSSLDELVDDGFIGGGFTPEEATTDAWGNAYQYSSSGETASLTSFGPDAGSGGGDDITLAVEGRPVLRSLTLDEMETIHVALRSHEIARGKGDAPDLPNYWLKKNKKKDGAMEILVGEDLLPDDEKFEKDAWGNVYGYEGSPADEVTSPEIDD